MSEMVRVRIQVGKCEQSGVKAASATATATATVTASANAIAIARVRAIAKGKVNTGANGSTNCEGEHEVITTK